MWNVSWCRPSSVPTTAETDPLAPPALAGPLHPARGLGELHPQPAPAPRPVPRRRLGEHRLHLGARQQRPAHQRPLGPVEVPGGRYDVTRRPQPGHVLLGRVKPRPGGPVDELRVVGVIGGPAGVVEQLPPRDRLGVVPVAPYQPRQPLLDRVVQAEPPFRLQLGSTVAMNVMVKLAPRKVVVGGCVRGRWLCRLGLPGLPNGPRGGGLRRRRRGGCPCRPGLGGRRGLLGAGGSWAVGRDARLGGRSRGRVVCGFQGSCRNLASLQKWGVGAANAAGHGGCSPRMRGWSRARH